MGRQLLRLPRLCCSLVLSSVRQISGVACSSWTLRERSTSDHGWQRGANLHRGHRLRTNGQHQFHLPLPQGCVLISAIIGFSNVKRSFKETTRFQTSLVPNRRMHFMLRSTVQPCQQKKPTTSNCRWRRPPCLSLGLPHEGDLRTSQWKACGAEGFQRRRGHHSDGAHQSVSALVADRLQLSLMTRCPVTVPSMDEMTRSTLSSR